MQRHFAAYAHTADVRSLAWRPQAGFWMILPSRPGRPATARLQLTTDNGY